MGLVDWIRSFAALHEKAKCGELDADALARYRAEREQLAHALLAVQRVSLEPGQRARRALRVARGLGVDVRHQDRMLRTQTLNISSGGFAILSPLQPEVGDEVKVALYLEGDVPVHARARAVDVRALRDGTTRVGFQFTELDDEDAERLETLVMDEVIARLGG